MVELPNDSPVGTVLRAWRQRRRLSQMDLAGEADVSTRHLSYVESGRARPSRDMLLRLAEPLALPLRARNQLLLAGGFAPFYPEQPLEAPDMRAARDLLDTVLRAQEPYPALAVDRHWTLIAANAAVAPLLAEVTPRLLAPPVNVLRLSLAPDGLAPAILNLAEWRHHLLGRLRHDAVVAADPVLHALHAELAALPAPRAPPPRPSPSAIAIPLVMRQPGTGRCLSFLSTTTVFGTAVDITLSELTLESFYPADAETREALMGVNRGR